MKLQARDEEVFLLMITNAISAIQCNLRNLIYRIHSAFGWSLPQIDDLTMKSIAIKPAHKYKRMCSGLMVSVLRAMCTSLGVRTMKDWQEEGMQNMQRSVRRWKLLLHVYRYQCCHAWDWDGLRTISTNTCKSVDCVNVGFDEETLRFMFLKNIEARCLQTHQRVQALVKC